VNWRARIDRITDDHIAAVRRMENRIVEIDEQARAATRRMGERVGPARDEPETWEERVAREEREERDRLLREASVRARAAAAERARGYQSGKEVYVLPTDWTEEDEARAEGYGPPESWLV
jgi:hypothetical protein